MQAIQIIDNYAVSDKKEQDFKIVTLKIFTTYHLDIKMYCQSSKICEALDKGEVL